METEKKVLQIIQKTLALENPPSLEDSFFDDLNAHEEEMEMLRAALNTAFNIEIEENDFRKVQEVKEAAKLVKDYTDDIS